MRALIQRVAGARVTVAEVVAGEIGAGCLVLLGVNRRDDEDAANKLADKTAALRIFSDQAGKMNRSLVETGGSALVVSQFTLYAETHKGNRPSFIEAASGEMARQLYEHYVARLRLRLGDDRVATGVFAARMQVELVNDGPVTLWLECD